MLAALDANLFIYLLQGHKEFGHPAAQLFERSVTGELELCASQLVWAETLSSSEMSTKQAATAMEVMKALPVKYHSISEAVLLQATQLRRVAPVKLPDAIHLASAIIAGCDTFITNDRALLKLEDLGLEMVSLKQ